MTQEEARIRLAVSPPELEERFWTVVAIYDGGGCAFLPDGVSYGMAVDRCLLDGAGGKAFRDSKERAEKVAAMWTKLAGEYGDPVAFVAVEARRALKCAE